MTVNWAELTRSPGPPVIESGNATSPLRHDVIDAEAEAARQAARARMKRQEALDLRGRAQSRADMRRQVVEQVLREQQTRARVLHQQPAAVSTARETVRSRNIEVARQMRNDEQERKLQVEHDKLCYAARGREMVESERLWQQQTRGKWASPPSTPKSGARQAPPTR